MLNDDSDDDDDERWSPGAGKRRQGAVYTWSDYSSKNNDLR